MIEFDVNNMEWLRKFKDIKSKYKYDNGLKVGVGYFNLAVAFDIETTSIYDELNNKVAFMYEWTVALEDVAVYGRDWDSFKMLLNELRLWFMLSPTERLVVYVHNLGFEFQFMCKEFEWIKVFAVDERKPIVAVCKQGFEFRDSYILSGYSLEKTAENLTSHSIRKLVGDLDYSLIRHSETEMTEKELAYCENDVLIITAYIQEQIEQYGDITKIPLTNTGRVRSFVRQNCLRDMKRKGGKGIGKRYRELMTECKLDLRSYVFCKKAFQGGFTHASNKYVNEVLKDVHSIDFNSSYPYAMVSEKYPMSRPLELEDTKMVFDNDDYCYLIRVKIKKLHSKFTYESYLSESKCSGDGFVSVNGRLFSADWVETIVTDVDLRIIMQTYEYKSLKILDGYYFYKQYLPRTVIDSILTLYQNKTELKGVEDKAVEYLLSKGMLNSVYGMCVTDIVREENVFEGNEWVKSRPDIQNMMESISKDNENRNRFLYYPWGVWVTAYARYNLWNGIIEMGDDYVYSDTDSIKFLNYESHTEYIKEYNNRCLDKLKVMCDFRKFDIERCRPKGRLLGVFDYEGKVDRFKTLGAKRYMTYSEEKGYKLTVAGLSKQNGMDYIRELCNDDVEKVFEMFDDGLSIPKERTGKNTHTYVDREYELDVTDYRGVTSHIKTLSGVHLEKAGFELGMSGRYLEFLKAFKDGYILKRGYI